METGHAGIARGIRYAGIVAIAAAIPAVAGAWLAPTSWSVGAAVGASVAAATALLIFLRSSREISRLTRIQRSLHGDVATLERTVREQSDLLEKSRSLDDVTGVLNRKTFLTRFDETIRRDARLAKPLALLLVDLDGFRRMNVEHGRLVGDEALKEVARSLRGATRGTDFVGRLGGDEFAVVLGECADPRPVIDRLFVSLEGLTVGHGAVRLSAAVAAVKVEDPAEGWDVGEVLRAAEQAIADVRGKGGGVCASRTLRRQVSATSFPR